MFQLFSVSLLIFPVSGKLDPQGLVCTNLEGFVDHRVWAKPGGIDSLQAQPSLRKEKFERKRVWVPAALF